MSAADRTERTDRRQHAALGKTPRASHTHTHAGHSPAHPLIMLPTLVMDIVYGQDGRQEKNVVLPRSGLHEEALSERSLS